MAEDSVPEKWKLRQQDYDRKRYEAHKDEVLARQKEWRDANREEYRARCRESTAKYRAKLREINPPDPGPTPIERFYQNISIDETTGCWRWTAVRNHKGYAIMKIHQKSIIMHRFSYETFKGPIPPRLQIDHMCCVKECVNPDHLQVVTALENIRLRKERTGFHVPRKTHCPRGHEYTPENIYPCGKEKQYYMCRTCRNEASKRYYWGENPQ